MTEHHIVFGEVETTMEDIRRPVAVNLIQGKMTDVVLFLDRLSSNGEKCTPGLRETHALWRKAIELNRDWYPDLDR